jgi:hypothetical protein
MVKMNKISKEELKEIVFEALLVFGVVVGGIIFLIGFGILISSLLYSTHVLLRLVGGSTLLFVGILLSNMGFNVGRLLFDWL